MSPRLTFDPSVSTTGLLYHTQSYVVLDVEFRLSPWYANTLINWGSSPTPDLRLSKEKVNAQLEGYFKQARESFCYSGRHRQ